MIPKEKQKKQESRSQNSDNSNGIIDEHAKDSNNNTNTEDLANEAFQKIKQKITRTS